MAVDITAMHAVPTRIGGLLRITTKAVTDERGTVREFFRTSGFAELGIDVPGRWRQINLTWTGYGGIRGLHGEASDKLIGIAAGTAFGVWLDARADSPTRGEVVTAELAVGTQMLVPAGVCNGFQATSPQGCQYLYCFGVEWSPTMAGVAVTPLDPALAIDWPIPPDPSDPSKISAKDVAAPRFEQL